ncbi:hydroxymethylglutaryl-CoA reductase [Plectosphaerella cucumerina]|uniref:Hydroxymethylglutaryl-CoA reductase n=1 Tax=Plectosphaerella cucumerina TaxID=40658 RepID=A0A8K0TUM7_9PEZI|nr:hydroxymethylglutaryl-CoA reductase [Plectosphaerella cucumerina]
MNRLSSVSGDMPETSGHHGDLKNIRIENCIGFSKVPLGIAGPLRINSTRGSSSIYAPLATYEPTIIASCSRGCKAFNASGGVHFEVLGDGMSRAPVFTFKDPGHAVVFSREIPTLREKISTWAESTSRHVRLQDMRPTVIGSQVHVLYTYTCDDAAGQNMVTKATQHACDMLRRHYGDTFSIQGFFVEGQMASDKKPS